MLAAHPVPRATPAPSDSSDFVPGALAASMRGRKRRIKQLCRHFFSLGLVQERMLTGFEKKDNRNWPPSPSLPPPAALHCLKKKTHKLQPPDFFAPSNPQIKGLERGRRRRGLPQSRPISLRGANYPN